MKYLELLFMLEKFILNKSFSGDKVNHPKSSNNQSQLPVCKHMKSLVTQAHRN